MGATTEQCAPFQHTLLLPLQQKSSTALKATLINEQQKRLAVLLSTKICRRRSKEEEEGCFTLIEFDKERKRGEGRRRGDAGDAQTPQAAKKVCGINAEHNLVGVAFGGGGGGGEDRTFFPGM